MPDRTVVVTGANRGLGLETSRQLAERGCRVVLTARSLAQAEIAASSLEGAGQVLPAALDVTSAASIQAFRDYAQRELGQLDALVNNAGISLRGFDAEVVRGTLAVNFLGALHVTQAISPLLADGGNIVMVSSGMGELSAYSPTLRARFLDVGLGVPKLVALVEEFQAQVAAGQHIAHGWPSSAYRVSKAALNALTRILTREDPRLRVNAVCPGWVQTDMGGSGASRSVQTGAAGIVWAATLDHSGPRGGFFRDGHAISW